MNVAAEREQTFESPFLHSIDPEASGANSFHQHLFVKNAFERFLTDPFEKGADLRGKSFELTVHSDGLFVTIRER